MRPRDVVVGIHERGVDAHPAHKLTLPTALFWAQLTWIIADTLLT